MIRRIANRLLRFLPHLVFRGKQVFLVSGMRRSGNHAFIAWFANGLTQSNCRLDYSRNHFVGLSCGGRVVHINEVNAIGILATLRLIWAFYREIRTARWIILSEEDCDPNHHVFIDSSCDSQIYVDRTTLNLLASRIRGMERDQHNPLVQQNFAIDRNLLEKIREWRRLAFAGEDVHLWHYDRWQAEPEYRRQFLQLFGLSHDQMPSVSRHGGGSSFTGDRAIPTSTEARFRQVAIPEEVIGLVSSGFDDLLTPEELHFLLEAS